MPFVDDDTAREYRAAWAAWLKQVEHVHRVFLEGERIEPAQMKGLLNREVRAKEAYDAARLKLLGLDASPLSPAEGSDTNPFR